MLEHHVECADCRGTGHEQFDCWLCDGHGTVHWRRAARHGVKKSELTDLEDDGYGECPNCEGRLCWICKGDGMLEDDVADQARERVLICALTGEVPPVVRRQPWRRRIDLDNDTMLSRVAADACREEGLLHWFCSFMGDELHLTDAGKEAARIAQVRHTLRAGVNI